MMEPDKIKEENQNKNLENGPTSYQMKKESFKIDKTDVMSSVSDHSSILTYKQRNFRPRRSMSETSVYRANSRYTLKTGVNQSSKTLDRLMQCFWVCSPGCQQTTA